MAAFRQDFLDATSWPQRKDGFPSDLLDALQTLLFHAMHGSQKGKANERRTLHCTELLRACSLIEWSIHPPAAVGEFNRSPTI